MADRKEFLWASTLSRMNDEPRLCEFHGYKRDEAEQLLNRWQETGIDFPDGHYKVVEEATKWAFQDGASRDVGGAYRNGFAATAGDRR